ncbi:hypothetical protein, partial [Vibrio sp. OPT18]|uniref:hypothetical protein n=1 Tax=Vibrio sp. OPT18 TaxID=2778641 RepID=UPI001D14A2DA
ILKLVSRCFSSLKHPYGVCEVFDDWGYPKPIPYGHPFPTVILSTYGASQNQNQEPMAAYGCFSERAIAKALALPE